MSRIAHYIVQHLAFRRCRGCDSPDPHSHHLTWVGYWRYVRRFPTQETP